MRHIEHMEINTNAYKFFKENLKERARDSHTLLRMFPFNILPSTPSLRDFFSSVLLNKTFYPFLFSPF
jgi:hypothetical protein